MEYFHLTTPQQNIWNLQKYYNGTSIANLCGATFYREKRDSVLLQQAIRRFIQNQSGIRLRFCEGERPSQYVSDEIDENIPIKTFSSMEECDRYAEEFAAVPLELTGRFQYRFVVFHVENRSGILVLLSHLVADAWTFGLLAKQLDEAYHKLAGESEAAENISLIKADYTSYIHSENSYLASDRYRKDKEYWEEKYADRPEESPMKLSSALSESITAKRFTKVLPFDLEQKMGIFCKANSVTPAVLFETALIIYLYRINPEITSVTVGVPVLNRSNAKEKEIAGMFVSTMPLTVSVKENMTGLELARQITKEHMNIFRHQKYPYVDILKFLREKHKFSGNLYSAMISYQNAKTDTQADTKWYSNGCSEVPFVMHIDNRDGNTSHTINVDYQTEVFGEEEIRYILKRLEYVLVQITENKNVTIKEIDILPQKERKRIVCEFNDTYVDYPRNRCVHGLFSEQAARTPDQIALVFEDKRFTYRQLDEMSNSLGHFLREKGIKPNDVVPVIARRIWHVIVAMLGILKAGGAYMPVSPEYPEDRIRHILMESKAKIALVYQFSITHRDISVIDIKEVNFCCNLECVENINYIDDYCYIIYTSGSTGKPKGICQTHKCLSNLLLWQILQDKRNHSRILASTILTFDVSIQEIMYSLIKGGCLFFTKENIKNDMLLYMEFIQKNMINEIFITPSYFNLVCKLNKLEKISTLKNIFFAGEKFGVERDIFEKLRESKVRIWNQYGPAETHVATYKEVHNALNVTIGKPISNTQIYILDRSNKILPIGVPGELCIAGEGVGKGYLNRPELTAERFVPNPFATPENHHGKIMYHTGDLARWRTDGEIEYLGRIDTQVKIRGLRIELGEIESVMGTMAGIGLTAVTDKRDEDNRQYLAGYYTAETEIDERRLREHLAAKLPQYMIPNFFIRLESMPMMSSGKIDRRNLPVPNIALQKKEYLAPETDTEKKLALLWQQVFHVEKIGKTDDFYELGGDSLTAIVLVNEIGTTFQVEISAKDVLECSLLEQLALRIDQAHERKQIEAHREKKYILLPQQKAIYAAYTKDPAALTYNMPARIPLPENINREKLKQSICQIAEKHKILKSHITTEEDEIYGIYDEDIPVLFEDYTQGGESAFIRPFCLEKAPLIRIGFTEKALLFDMHHMIADGDSLNIILRDMVAAYAGKEIKTPEIQFSDYARYFYELDMKEGINYFKEMLTCDFEPVLLPETKTPGKGGRSKFYDLPEEVFERAKKYAERNGLTDTMVFLGAYGILLSKYSAGKDILTGIVLQNRTHADTRDMVGMFVNTLPLCLAVRGNLSEYMESVKETLLNLFQYQELPFWNIANAVGMKDKSVVNTSFVYQGDGEKTLMLDGHELVPQFIDTHTAKFDLTMELTPLKSGCRIRLEYDLAKYDEQLMDRLSDAYVRILTQLEKESIADISTDISVMSEEELYQVTEAFNDTYVDYPRDKCVHELFSEQAARTPDQIALVFEEERFTYRQLDEMSNSLAHFLRERGVKPNDVVPVIAKRSWHVIVAMLGILKAGGAYMTVSPGYPEERIAHMIQIAKSRIALSFGYEKGLGIETIRLENSDYRYRESAFGNSNRPEDLAYIIFTSGSTGVPKGIMICHGNILRNPEKACKINDCTEEKGAYYTTTTPFLKEP